MSVTAVIGALLLAIYTIISDGEIAGNPIMLWMLYFVLIKVY